jgi:hypothetical protein
MLLATLKCRERGALQFPVQNFNSSAALLSYFDLYQRQVLVSALTKVAWKFVCVYRINSKNSRNASKGSPLRWLGGVLGGV